MFKTKDPTLKHRKLSPCRSGTLTTTFVLIFLLTCKYKFNFQAISLFWGKKEKSQCCFDWWVIIPQSQLMVRLERINLANCTQNPERDFPFMNNRYPPKNTEECNSWPQLIQILNTFSVSDSAKSYQEHRFLWNKAQTPQEFANAVQVDKFV